MLGIMMLGLGVGPTEAEAGVYISEVAWMGTVTSANHEWIELHNDGEEVSVEGWVLTDGNNLQIKLSGTLAGQSYAVLERTGDESAPGTAFLIYTGALVNSGATLRLLRSDGSVVDQLSGGENWNNIGGDNVTKETAQYTNSGWVTAPATPGGPPPMIIEPRENTATSGPATGKSASTKSTGLVIGKKPDKLYLELPGVTLRLDISAQPAGYVHQTLSFSVTPSGIGDNLANSLQYQWNFGDGTIASGQNVTHVYRYPGTYVVTVYGGYKRQEQVARHEITILPVTISLTTNEKGDVQINNDSPYELDISGYTVQGERSFVFPPRSIVLSGQTITIARQKLGIGYLRPVAVYDTEAQMIARLLPPGGQSNARVESATDRVTNTVTARVVEPVSLPLPPVPRVSSLQTSVGSFGFATASTTELATTGLETTVHTDAGLLTNSEDLTTESVGQLAMANTSSTNRPIAYVALVVLLSLALLFLLMAPKRK